MLLKVVPMSLKEYEFDVNSVIIVFQDRRKLEFWPNFGFIGVKKGPKIWPAGSIIYKNLKVRLISFNVTQ